jgi:hypothetical protein
MNNFIYGFSAGIAATVTAYIAGRLSVYIWPGKK